MKDVMGPQGIVFLAFIVRLIIRSGKDERQKKQRGITEENRREPQRYGKDQTDKTAEGYDALP